MDNQIKCPRCKAHVGLLTNDGDERNEPMCLGCYADGLAFRPLRHAGELRAEHFECALSFLRLLNALHGVESINSGKHFRLCGCCGELERDTDDQDRDDYLCRRCDEIETAEARWDLEVAEWQARLA